MSDSTEKKPDGTGRNIDLARRSLLGAGALGAASLAAGGAIAAGTMSPEAEARGSNPLGCAISLLYSVP